MKLLQLLRGRKADLSFDGAFDALNTLLDKKGKVSEDELNAALDEVEAATKREADATKKKEAGSDFVLTRDKATGGWRWLAVVSNNFYDREKEVFPAEAHQDYVAYVDETKDYPELWVWHTPGSRIGVADFVDFDGHFLIASGVIDKNKEVVAKSLSRAKQRLGVSHGYKYRGSDLREDGSYARYRSFEVSVLPQERASNPWTEWTAQTVKEAGMLRADKKAFLVEHFGEDGAGRIEGHLEGLAKELVDSGVQFKELLTTEEAPTGDGGSGGNATPAVEASAPAAAAAADDPAGSDDADETKLAEELVAGVKSLNSSVEAVKELLGTLNTTVSELGTRVETLEKSDDEKLSDRIAPRRKPDAAMRPTDSAANLADEATAERLKEETKDENATPVSPFIDQLSRNMGLPTS